MQLKVTTGDEVLFVMLHIMAKGILLDTIKLNFDSDGDEDNDKMTVIYTFKPSFKHAPEAHILAYYIKKDGDFVVGQDIFMLRSDLPNYVRLNFLLIYIYFFKFW